MDDASSSRREHGWLLLQLPGPAQQALVAQLAVGERRSLRLACKAATTLVDQKAAQLRLTVTQLHQDSKQLQQRFPSVVQLLVLLATSGAASPEPLLRPIVAWPAITTVLLEGGTLHTAARVLAKLPHLDSCAFSSVQLPTATEAEAMASAAVVAAAQEAELSSFTSVLPQRVMSLAWEDRQQLLNSQQLLALAQMPLLTRLQVRVSSSYSWVYSCDTCGRMQTLRSLDVVLGMPYDVHGTYLPVADLRGLSLLTQLQWHAVMALRYSFVTDLVCPAALQLPTSLVQLRLDQLPQGALPALPQLTSLVLTHQTLNSQTLAALAISSPALRSLEVQQLLLTESFCGVQLTSVTKLRVTGCCSSSEGTQFSSVFPQLQALAVRHPQGVISSHGLAAMQGMTSLAYLDVDKEHTSWWPGLQMGQRDFELLAALPMLASLRLVLQHEYVAHLALLPHLQRMEWVWDWRQSVAGGTDRALEELQASLSASTAPAQLRTAAVCCLPSQACLGSSIDRVSGMIQSLASWLARAPALTEVQWATNGWGRESRLALHELGALAASITLRRVVLDFTADPADLQLEPAVRDMVHQFRVRGLDVEVLQRHD